MCYLKSAYDTTKPYVFAGEGSWTDYYFPGFAQKNGYEACMKKAGAQTMQACGAEKTELATAATEIGELVQRLAAAEKTNEKLVASKENLEKTNEKLVASKEKAEVATQVAEVKATTAEVALADAKAAKKTAEDKATAAEAAKEKAEDALAAAKASATTQDKLTEAKLRLRVKCQHMDVGPRRSHTRIW